MLNLDEPLREVDLYRASVSVLRSHESKDFLGGVIASLSIPWGFDKGDEDLGGYHLVWPRDLVETAGGFLAAGAEPDALRVLRYLEVTQEADGHWGQNMWLDGTSLLGRHADGRDGFPDPAGRILRRAVLAFSLGDLKRWWPMVGRPRVSSYATDRSRSRIVGRKMPATRHSPWRWRSPRLLAAADLADGHGLPRSQHYLRETADCWNENIERWMYATDSDLARQLGVDGYYVRIAPPDADDAASPLEGFVPIKNRPPDQRASNAPRILISPDSLALVRFGLRARRRSTHPEHRESDRRAAQSGTAARPLLVSLQRRRLR